MIISNINRKLLINRVSDSVSFSGNGISLGFHFKYSFLFSYHNGRDVDLIVFKISVLLLNFGGMKLDSVMLFVSITTSISDSSTEQFEFISNEWRDSKSTSAYLLFDPVPQIKS